MHYDVAGDVSGRWAPTRLHSQCGRTTPGLSANQRSAVLVQRVGRNDEGQFGSGQIGSLRLDGVGFVFLSMVVKASSLQERCFSTVSGVEGKEKGIDKEEGEGGEVDENEIKVKRCDPRN